MVGNSSQAEMSLLAGSGLHGTACPDGRQALAMLKAGQYTVVLCALKMPGVDVTELMEQVLAAFPAIAFVAIAEPGNLRDGILAMLSGASDYISGPLAPEVIEASLERAQNRKRAECGLKRHMKRPAVDDNFQSLNAVAGSSELRM